MSCASNACRFSSFALHATGVIGIANWNAGGGPEPGAHAVHAHVISGVPKDDSITAIETGLTEVVGA